VKIIFLRHPFRGEWNEFEHKMLEQFPAFRPGSQEVHLAGSFFKRIEGGYVRIILNRGCHVITV
jgi:hypothetical protein